MSRIILPLVKVDPPSNEHSTSKSLPAAVTNSKSVRFKNKINSLDGSLQTSANGFTKTADYSHFKSPASDPVMATDQAIFLEPFSDDLLV